MENIRLAFQGIWGHKMRSVLTMLGIIIGIAAIITIVSTIQGTNEQIKENLIGSGSNVVTVQLYQDTYPYDMSYNPIPAGVKVIEASQREEMEKLDGVKAVSLFHVREWSEGVSAGLNTFGGATYGVDETYFTTTDYRLTYGRSFTQGDYENFRRVAVLDKKAAATLFPGEYPIGQTVEVKTEPFVVVGVVEKGSTFAPVINSIDDYYMYADTSAGSLFIPSAVWPTVYRFDEPQCVAVRAESTDDMTKAGKNVADYLTANQISASAMSVPEDGMTEEVMTEDAVVEDSTVP